MVPLTLYNKYKGLCEPILNKYGTEDFTVTTFRPATVCGYAPRLRLDLSVNILTNHAITNNKITVFGGKQLRPNLDVRDYVDACLLLMNAPHEVIHKDVYNVGYQNMSIMDIAQLVREVVLEQFENKKKLKSSLQKVMIIALIILTLIKLKSLLGLNQNIILGTQLKAYVWHLKRVKLQTVWIMIFSIILEQ